MASVFKRGGEGNWLAAWHDHNGRRHVRSTKTTDKKAAERIAAKFEADAALRREGVIDPQLESINGQAKRTIESHLKDYEAHLASGGGDAKHVRDTVRYIQQISEAVKARVAADLSADTINHFAKRMKADGYSNRTIQAHLTAIKSFTKWLAAHGKLARDPLASVKKLRSLTPGKLFLDGERAYVICKAKATKNAKDCKQYVQPDLAAELRQHLLTVPASRVVFKMPRRQDVSPMFKADLATARQAWLDEVKDDPAERERREQSDFLAESNHEGEVLDFHSPCGTRAGPGWRWPAHIPRQFRPSCVTARSR